MPNDSEPKTSRQLVLDLELAPSYAAEDFLESPSNAEALATIDRWPDWPDRTLILSGPAGCGKSHLGAIWAARTGACTIGTKDRLWSDDGSFDVPVFLEDADRAGRPETDLFHLINRIREGGGWLLVTAREPPMRWGLHTLDLVSRLRLAPLVPIGRPDASLMRAVIVKLCADRQIRIDEDVVAYAVLHCEQSLDAINRFVAAVDHESLAAGRRITRPLAAQAIAKLEWDRLAPDDHE